jgi:hypothetical protein
MKPDKDYKRLQDAGFYTATAGRSRSLDRIALVRSRRHLGLKVEKENGRKCCERGANL